MSFVIPVFITHEGCPHTCIFCDQQRISGQGAKNPVTPAEVQKTIFSWLQRKSGRHNHVQVAFYGGSFTGLSLPRQQELLNAVRPFSENGQVQTIRLSTRPDYIEGDTVSFLLDHGVSIVELGVQSLDNAVLKASHRGHTVEDVYQAVDLLQKGGMRVGLQLMLGLPEQTSCSLMQTVKVAAALQPEFVRIYPMLILQKSKLEHLYRQGAYKPLSLDKAVLQAAWMKKYFDEKNIPVVRMGLQPNPELEKSIVAGPYHPAFGELVLARIMLNKTRKALYNANDEKLQVLSISAKDESIFRGVQSANIKRLRELGLAEKFSLVKDASQPRYTLKKIIASEMV